MALVVCIPLISLEQRSRCASRKQGRIPSLTLDDQGSDTPLPSSPKTLKNSHHEWFLGRFSPYNGNVTPYFETSWSERTWCAPRVRARECIGSGGKDSCESVWLHFWATSPGGVPFAEPRNCSEPAACERAHAIQAIRRETLTALRRID